MMASCNHHDERFVKNDFRRDRGENERSLARARHAAIYACRRVRVMSHVSTASAMVCCRGTSDQWELRSSKDARQAAQLKEEGNVAFRRAQHKQAIALYTQVLNSRG